MFADFLVVDIFDEDCAGCGDLIEVGDLGGGLGWYEFDFETGLFFDFSEGGLDGIFVGFDMSARWQPGLNAVVPVEEGGVAVNNEAGGGEVAGER